MTPLELTAPEIAALVGTRHAVAGFEYPVAGLQPYYAWFVRTLHLLGESGASAGGLRVARDGESATSVAIAPGRASIDGDAVAFAGATLDLASYNNAVAHVWLARDGEDAVISHGPAGDGWPDGETTPHVKLAEVTLSAGEVTAILDRSGEALFTADGPIQITDAALTAPVGIAKGGTGATTASAARDNLGLGDIATHDAAEFWSAAASAQIIPVTSGAASLTLDDGGTARLALAFSGGASSISTTGSNLNITASALDLTAAAINITSTSGSVTIAGTPSIQGAISIAAAFGNTLGFFGASPSAQPSSANQAAVTPGNSNGEFASLTFSGAYDAAEIEALRDKCEELADDCRAAITLANELRAALVTLGLIKGSA